MSLLLRIVWKAHRGVFWTGAAQQHAGLVSQCHGFRKADHSNFLPVLNHANREVSQIQVRLRGLSRSPVTYLSDFFRAGPSLCLRCRQCKHAGEVEVALRTKRYTMNMPTRDLLKLFKCDEFGGRNFDWYPRSHDH